MVAVVPAGSTSCRVRPCTHPSWYTTPVGANVSVLDHDFWLSEFGGRNVIGEPLQVRNVPMKLGVRSRSEVGDRFAQGSSRHAEWVAGIGGP